ncbi:hypothetical protein AVV27_gp37 [Achromobacter phage 83-24]|uniref:Uncharacterized protein n=1 Tax=Achromobacter phage 83-24 TaxID=1589747 RepID=A0A0B5A5B2_9CAUD|nr:hypothetical protein AVV27_gp37 [Achromobacter phage 83-24]AJD82870.1 hypothetical protein JWAP_00037 [Achromobacter phage 83-24]
MANKTSLQVFLANVAAQAGRKLTADEKVILKSAFNTGDGRKSSAAARGVIKLAKQEAEQGIAPAESAYQSYSKQRGGQRKAYDDLNKQAQKQSSEELVDSRSALYGTFCGRAELTVDLMERLQKHPKWPAIPSWGKWALTMLVEKIGRIVEGDPSYDDNWKDIGGYAELARRNSVGEKA